MVAEESFPAWGRMVGNTEVSLVSTKQVRSRNCAFLCGQPGIPDHPDNLDN
jgi:hypothetical protein